MNRRIRKMASVWLALTLLVALFAPMIAPADAYSVNRISELKYVDSHWASDDPSSSGGGGGGFGSFGFGALSILTIREDSDFYSDLRDGNSFALTLTPGVKWVQGCYSGVVEPVDGFPVIYRGAPTGVSDYTALLATVVVTDNRMEITVPMGATSATEVDTMVIPLYVDINGFTGDVSVTIDALDSGLTSNSYRFAVSLNSRTIASAGNIKDISDTGEGELIRIDENYAGALAGKQNINLKLSDGFAWDSFKGSDLVVSGGYLFNTVDYDIVNDFDSQTLEISIDLGAATFTKGSIFIKTPIKALAGAQTGIIEATVTGSPNVNEAVVVVGWYKAPAPEYDWQVADVNGDGVVNGLDITALLTYFGR